MSDNIPFDIQEEILKRLPVKSLVQFRSVSKPWKSLIDSSEFIANYHRTQPQHHLLVSSRHNKTFISIADNDTFPHQKLSVTVPMSLNILKIPMFVGSSQGLFCFYGFGTKTVVIWNPTIRKSVSISLPDELVLPDLAFGVCPGTCDPKLVKFTFNRRLGVGDHVVGVFRLSTKVWKRLTTNFPRNLVVVMKKQVVIERFIYWRAIFTNNVAVGHKGYKNLIMSFDMITEEFKELYLPDTLALGPEYDDLFISKVRESLVVVQMRSKDVKRVASVWMMGDNDQKLFTKQFIINMPNGIYEVHGFRRNGQPIIGMVEEVAIDLFVYEGDSEHINRIGINVPQVRYSCNVSSYTETLLMLDH